MGTNKSTNMFCANDNEIFIGSILEDDINIRFVVEEHPEDGAIVISAENYPSNPICSLEEVVDRLYVIGSGW